jgi:hypothetical protein
MVRLAVGCLVNDSVRREMFFALKFSPHPGGLPALKSHGKFA